MEAKAVAAKQAPAATVKGIKGALIEAAAKGASKGGKNRNLALDEGTVKDSDYPVSNCVGAGIIEGWFASSRATVDDRGWGQMQSYSFEGNLVFRSTYCPLLKESDYEYKPKDPVHFEVVG